MSALKKSIFVFYGKFVNIKFMELENQRKKGVIAPARAKIERGAIFAADAHFNPINRSEILAFLDKIINGEIKTKQLFLLGDMSDLLIGGFEYLLEFNKPLIERIAAVADRGIEVYYFEGNHDFLLNEVFSNENIKIIERGDQPKLFDFCGREALILHGDREAGIFYEIYTLILRNKILLKLLNIFLTDSVKNAIFGAVLRRQQTKKMYRKIANFTEKRSKKIEDWLKAADIVIEGHFHQGAYFGKLGAEYKNLWAFASPSGLENGQFGENKETQTRFIRLEYAQIGNADEILIIEEP
ncbi:MAG: UDP-2,3-diacylglucosamine diphosphatase [Helicobacteraceae bacterium]|jgi:UDP-2,3-diacylglucosamine hydrolase|nr:UDP-2,3-diacylglucosamine diphosphatase [Helicobacteraceae bacterium]